MKKIFAIALALVMVLSMASAFAFVGTCGDYAYTCPTVGCGVAKAEVVQFVANNTVDKYEESTCAGVVAGQDIFYGVKVIFDKDVNEQWYNHADTRLNISRTNTKNDSDWTSTKSFSQMTGKTAAEVSGKTFWYEFTTGNLVSAFNPETCVIGYEAKNTRAEVCANVKYDFNGVTYKTDEDLDGDWINYGSFEVAVAKNFLNAQYIINVKKGGDQIDVYVIGGVVKYVTVKDSGVYYYDNAYNGIKGSLNANGEAVGTKTSTTADCSVIDDLMALIKLDFGYCVDGTVIKNIFGWENGDPDCATWNKDAKAIVNAECEVQVMSIPKTGDASVLAWLF